MKISEVNVKLLGEDILSIINEFVKVEGLTLNKVTVEDGIILEGKFKKGFTIDFMAKAEIVDCTNNKITARLAKVKVLNLGIFRIVRSFVLKKVANILKDKGISSEKDKVIVDVNKILQDVPFIDLKINEIFIKGSELWAETSDINISLEGKLVKKVEAEEVVEEKADEEKIEELEAVVKVNDSYAKGRKILEDKLSDKTKKYKDYLFILPDIASLIYRLLKEKRVPTKTKLVISAAIGYISFPTDIIPDNIPFIGAIDDIGVLFFALNKIIEDIPLSIIVENWSGKNDILLVLKKGLEYLTNFTGAQNIERIYDAIEELSTL